MIGSLIGGIMGKAGGDAAAGAAMDAANQQKQANERARLDTSSWREAGRRAIDETIQLLGLGRLYATEHGDFVDPSRGDQDQAAAFARFKTDPDYQFRQREGEKSINRSLAARGGALSGAAVRAGVRFNQDLAAGAFKNYFDRISGVAGLGASAATSTAANTVAGAKAAGDDIVSAGQARKSGYESLGSGITSGFNNVLAAGLYGKKQGWF